MTVLNMRKHRNAATEQAAEWFVRLHSGRETADDHIAFLDWLSESPEHQSEFDLIETNWDLAGALETDPEFVGYLEAPVSSLASVPTALQRLRRHGPGSAMAAAALVLLIAVGLWAGPGGAVYRTAVGEQKIVHLADGSAVHLNTGTEIRVAFDDHLRRVRLSRGEAIFSVEKDPARPFVVAAGEREVRAVGTEFDVLRIDGEVKVAVLKGVVDISTPTIEPTAGAAVAPGPRLLPGEQVTYNVQGQVSAKQAADIGRIAAWRAGRLEFDATTLAQVVAELNRYSSVQVVIGDDALRGIRVSGSFRIGNTDAVIRALQESFPVRAVTSGRDIVLLSRISGR